jgi:hypothetical protein
VEAVRALAGGDRAETSVAGLVLTAGTAILEPALGVAKRRIGARLGSAATAAATAGEGAQNLLCTYLAIAVFIGLAANTLLGTWWLDGVVALGIAGWAVLEGGGPGPGTAAHARASPAAALPSQSRAPGVTPRRFSSYLLPKRCSHRRAERSAHVHAASIPGHEPMGVPVGQRLP